MKLLIVVIFLFYAHMLHSKEVLYDGEVSFKVDSNMPGMSLQGVSKSFRILRANFSDDNTTINKIEAELDSETLRTGIELRDQQMHERIFLVLSANEKPSLIKMLTSKLNCEKKDDNLHCTGEANFTLGKKSVVRKLDLKFDNKLNTEMTLNFSVKELGLAVPSHLGVELEDKIVVKIKVSKK